MSDNVVNFLKYKVKRDFVDPTYNEINDFSLFFDRQKIESDILLLQDFFNAFAALVKALEEADWVEYKVSEKIWDEFRYSRRKVHFIANKRLTELGF